MNYSLQTRITHRWRRYIKMAAKGASMISFLLATLICVIMMLVLMLLSPVLMWLPIKDIRYSPFYDAFMATYRKGGKNEA